jgi:PAS domain S-box-containing protein
VILEASKGVAMKKYPLAEMGAGRTRELAQELTERKQADALLQASEKRLRDIIFSIADWIWEVDENGVYTYSSQKGFDLFGPSREDLIGKTPFDFMPPDEAKRVAAIFSEIVARKAPIINLENWNIAKNGERICLLTNGVPMLDPEGNLKGYRGVDQDITKRKQVEEALKASEVRYRRLFESAKDGILILDAETGMIVDVNPFLLELLGYAHEQLLGKAIWDVGFLKDVIANRNNFLELQQQECLRYEHLPLETAAGRRIDIEFVSHVFLAGHQKVIQCNIHDITELKMTERENLHQLDELRRWQAVMLGREDRSIKLKREVNEMLQRLGEPIRYPSQVQ